MRIVHLDSGRTMRGGQWQTLRLVEGLSKAGHSVTLLSPEDYPLLETAANLEMDAQPLTIGAVRKLSRSADVVHAHDARSHTIAALLSAAPLVVSRRVSFPIRGGLSRWKYARPRHFIAVSNYVKSILSEAGVGAEKTSVVYDGVPLLTPTLYGGKIIAPASSDPQKGAPLAQEGAKLAGMSLHMSANLERDLADASLFVYITHSEGLGSGILLAMSAGVPVVASNVGGIPEIIEHETSGLLVENNPIEIAKAISRLNGDRELSHRLASRARQMVQERFSISVLVKNTVQVYEKVLAC